MPEKKPHPTQFYCPYCGADPKQPCVRNGSLVDYPRSWYHDARANFRDGFLAGHKQALRESAKAVRAVESPRAQTRAVRIVQAAAG